MKIARTKKGIRTEKSYKRQEIAKKTVEHLLASRGYAVSGARMVKNRHLIEVVDPSGRRRVLWFKLGWNPGNHGTSAVQLTMLKRGSSGRRPATLSDAEVQRRISEKFDRARKDEVTDLLLFSLDNANREPIACLVLSLKGAVSAFSKSLTIDKVSARNGASPTLWLVGKSLTQKKLQSVVEALAVENLLSGSSRYAQSPYDDAIEDFAPDSVQVGDIVPIRSSSIVSRFSRNEEVRSRALARSGGICELCNKPGFLMANGKRYLESHHIQALGEDGPDTEDNVIALCANDHRRAHFCAEREKLGSKMKEIVRKKLASKRSTS